MEKTLLTPVDVYREFIESARQVKVKMFDDGTLSILGYVKPLKESEALGKWLIENCSTEYAVVLKSQLNHIPRADVEKFFVRVEEFVTPECLYQDIGYVEDGTNYIDEKWGMKK